MKIDVVIPVYNEAHILKEKIEELSNFLSQNCSDDWKIIIVDNASIDTTFQEMKKLEQTLARVEAIHLDKKGRGLALHFAWSNSKSDFVCYMDVDLSTDLSAFPKMVDAFKNGANVVIGSRLSQESKIKRCFFREFLSRGYNIFHKLVHQTHFSDAQCGFKGFNRKTIDLLLPLTKNQKWFFDTELLLLSEKFKLNIFEIPVLWIEDPDTRVNIRKAVAEDIYGIFRMKWMFLFDKHFKEQLTKYLQNQ